MFTYKNSRDNQLKIIANTGLMKILFQKNQIINSKLL